jgi:hypothetical protein
MSRSTILFLAAFFATALATAKLRADSIALSNVQTVATPFVQGAYQVAINDLGVIAGTGSSGGSQVGFVIPTSGSPYLIQAPGAASTQINGINNSGTLVGYSLTSSYAFEGFSYSNGTFTPISVGPYTYVEGINNKGDVTGYYGTPGDTATGFLIHGGVTTSFYIPGYQLNTFPTGVNDSDQVVGYYNGTSGGFLRQANGSFTTFGFPAAGINNSGIIVGSAAGTEDNSLGAVMMNGIEYTFSFPGAVDTFIDGINNNGEVIGTYLDSDYSPHVFEGQIGTSTPEPAMEAGLGILIVFGIAMVRRRACHYNSGSCAKPFPF